jgi:G3E family GTPase
MTDFLGPTQITDAEIPWPKYPGSTPPNRAQRLFLQRMHMDDSLVHDRADFGSGCICCSPDGDLTRALVALGAHREAAASRGDMHAITHAIVETTGLADPRPFTRLIGAEHVVSRHFSLDRVVCVIDPSSILSSLAEPRPDGGGANKATEQLRNSDAIIINGSSRSDKGVETSGEEAEEGALRVNPLLHVVRGMADKGRGVSGVTWQEMMGAERERGRDHLPCGVCEDEDEYIKVAQLVNMAGHDRTYSTGCCVERGGVIWSRAEAWIKEMLQSGEVLQIKGFVSVQCERDPTEEAYIEALSLAHPRPPLSRILTISAGGAAQATSTSLHIEVCDSDPLNPRGQAPAPKMT